MTVNSSKVLSRDSVAGLAIVAAGAGFMLTSTQYGIGSLTAMGSGFFPFAVGAIAVLIGLSVFVFALREPGERIQRPEVRSVLFVSASVLIFALLIDKAGMVLTILVSGTICAMADRENTILRSFLLSTGIAASIWLVFVQLLGMPIPVFVEF